AYAVPEIAASETATKNADNLRSGFMATPISAGSRNVLQWVTLDSISFTAFQLQFASEGCDRAACLQYSIAQVTSVYRSLSRGTPASYGLVCFGLVPPGLKSSGLAGPSMRSTPPRPRSARDKA